MFNLIKRITQATSILISLLLVSSLAQAVVIEAEGQALIQNGDLKTAREAAIQDASQQASMHAAVFISSNQVVRDGILEIDNMQISTLGQVSNIEILDEKIIGTVLHMRIRADVLIDVGCENGITNTYTKTMAVAAFPLQNLKHAQLGGLDNAPIAFANQLAQALNQQDKLKALSASRINVHPNLAQAGTSQLDDGSLSSVLQNINTLDVNYVVSGVIRDMSMIDPRVHAEQNYFIDLYNKLDYLSKKHLRTFSVDLFVHDGFSGNLVMQKTYQTAGLWNLDRGIRTGFGGAGFDKQAFGMKVKELRQEIAQDLAEKFKCEPYTARIDRVENNNIWISAGTINGVKEGDKLTVYRRSTFYTPDMRAQTQLSNTQQTLTIKNVQSHFSQGRINDTVQQHNIRPGDLVIAR